jgi:large subunit ribosomal protein L24
LRLTVDPIDRPLTAEADGVVWIERGVPRFEGTLNLARPVRPAPAGAPALIIEPWRLSTKFKGDATAAVLEQVEFQYGPDDRAIKLRGDAKLTLGPKPQFDGTLAATQVDLDRLLGLPEATRRRPLVAVKSFADFFAGAPRPPIPVKLGIAVENMMLAGATLVRVSSKVKSDGATWDVESLDFRAPGAAQVRLAGRIGINSKGITFAGPAKVEARDPRALVAWLTDRADAQVGATGPFRAEGEVELGSGALAIDKLKAEVDRMAIEGRLAYSWMSGDRPPRIEAVLSTPDIDLDRAYALAQGVFADTAFEWPREGALAITLGRAAVAGVEARRAEVNVQFDERGLAIERLAIGDFGGAALAVKGRIDTHLSSPRGAVTFDLDARALNGVAALIEKFSPPTAEQLRRSAGRFVPAKLRGLLAINSDPAAPGAPPLATFTIEGSAGTFRVNLQGDAGSAGDAMTIANLPHLAAGKVNLAGRVEAGDGGALVEFLGLDGLVVVDKRPGRVNFTATGALTGDMAVDGQLVAGGLDVGARGALRIAGPIAGLDLKLANANLRMPRALAVGRLGETMPAAFTARLALADGAVALTDLSGKIAGTDIKGRLKVGFAPTANVDGDIELGAVDLPAAVAVAVGVPAAGVRNQATWPAEPFEPGVFGSLVGKVAVKSARVALTQKLAARDVRGVLQFDSSELALQQIDGSLAGGRVAGDLAFERGPGGLSARGKFKFAGADVAELLPGDGRPPMSGRLTFDVDLAGTGRSPVALIGSLQGGGTFTLQDGGIMRLDPAAFEAVVRNVDQGLPIDATRIRDRMELALGNGGLPITLAEGAVTLTAGQLRLANTVVHAQGAELALTGRVDLAETAIDARLTLSGPELAGAPEGTRPEIGIVLKGPIEAPRRILDVTTFASWLALRAVEQQAKRVDAIEQQAKRDALESVGEPPANSYVPTATAPVDPPISSPPTSAPSIGTPPSPQPSLVVPRSIIRVTPETPASPPRPRPPAPAAAAPVPPLDIRPALR